MISIFISCTVFMGIPAAVGIYFLLRKDGSFKLFLTGVLCFLIAQPLLRLPLLDLMKQKTDWLAFLPYRSLILYFLFMGFTAGLFEEFARLIGLKLVCRNSISWTDGLAYGLGHGGGEAAWLFITRLLPAIRHGQSGIGLLAGAWERLFTMMIHVGLSFLVLHTVRTGQRRWLLLAITLHTCIDFLIILGNIWLVEGLIALEGTTALILCLYYRRRFHINDE